MPAKVPKHPHPKTVRDWLRFAVARFNKAGLSFGHGTTNAHDEAAYLILHTLKLPLDRLDPFFDKTLSAEETEAVRQVLRLRVEQRIPAAYLTNQAWLGDFRFYVDERVIVPRSYIAELLRDELSPWVKDPESVQRWICVPGQAAWRSCSRRHSRTRGWTQPNSHPMHSRSRNKTSRITASKTEFTSYVVIYSPVSRDITTSSYPIRRT
jgi:hypothetical protein